MSTRVEAARIGARLDRLPATRAVWMRVLLLSLGGFFEFYDLFFTGYIGPGLVRSGILTATTHGLFGATGIAGFVAAMFSGLLLGTLAFSFVADRLGRRAIFTWSLLWYTAATVVMAFQSTAFALNLWRFIAGIGVGVELVTIDTYLSELVPKRLRGRAFAYNQTIEFAAVPVVALLAWLLVPRSPLGLDGWRWVVLAGAAGAIFVWWIRRRVPESPRWLAQHGRTEEADRAMAELEARVERELGRPLPPPEAAVEPERERGNFARHWAEIWKPPYRRRTIMMSVFHLFQTVGFYGFSNWVPTLLIAQGITITNSLRYTFLIAIAAPFGPLAAASIADRIERKWQIVAAALAIAIFGLAFAQTTAAASILTFGVLLTVSNNILSFSCHAYQTELFPTRVRALAVGFVYSWSRLSVVLSAFVIAFVLDRFGVAGVFTLIAGSMAMVMAAVGWWGPRTNNLALETISK